MLQVQITTRHKHKRVPHKFVEKVVKRVSLGLLPSNAVLGVAFLNNREMTSVNEAYTGRSGTTDVLSFPLGVDSFDAKWHGEVLISLDKAAAQATEKGFSLKDEVLRLLIHSVVHLAGYDHHDIKSFKKMRGVEFGLLMEVLKRQGGAPRR